MIKPIEALNADTGRVEHFELHKVNMDKRGKIKSVMLLQDGVMREFTKTGQAIFYSQNKAISIPAYQLEARI